MQQVAQAMDSPLLTDDETEKLGELLLAWSRKPGHPRDSDGKPLLTQEMVSEAMREVLQARYEKKFEELEEQFVKPLKRAMELSDREQDHRPRQPPKIARSLLSIDAINSAVAGWTIAGWFFGLAYFNWFSSAGAHLPLWKHAILIIGGLFGSSILIGGGMAFVAAMATSKLAGRPDGSALGFILAGCISPVLSFFAAKYALHMFG